MSKELIRKVKQITGEANLSDYVFGKVQPQSLELEQAVLGALLLDKDALLIVSDILRPESFYPDAHQLIYKAILRLFEKSHPVDLLTVTEELNKSDDIENVGGSYYLVELTNRVVSSANLEYHARIVAQKFIERELIRVSSNVIKNAYDPTVDTFDLIEQAEKDIFSVTQNGYVKQEQEMPGIVSAFIKDLEIASKKPDGLTGVPSGFTTVDRLTGGWQKTDLVIIAGRPGMGKSSLAMTMALNAAMDFQKPVAVFSLEMGSKQLISRLASQLAEIEGSRLRDGKLEQYQWQQLHTAAERLSSIPMFIDDTPGLSIFELRAKCRRMKMRHDIQLVVVDYIQMMAGKENAGNRDNEIGQISRGLKALAKELDVPVIGLAQLSRAPETRGGSKRPQLSDLRESGNLEQDADIVSFIYRPEYYQILEDENQQSTKGLAEFIIAKHRNGRLDTVQLRFNDRFTQFTDLELFSNQFPTSDPFTPSNVITRTAEMNTEEPVPF